MSKFKAEEWQNYLDNMIPGYSRTVNNNKIGNTQDKNMNNEKEILPKQKKCTYLRIKINKGNIKRQYNKNIVFFDVNENTNYNSVASLIDKNKIYINSRHAEILGTNKLIYQK